MLLKIKTWFPKKIYEIRQNIEEQNCLFEKDLQICLQLFS